MKEIYVNKYLSEADTEIRDILENNNGLFIVANCGLGKSYYIKNFLMKKYKTVNCNFLNVLNLQTYSDSYVAGKEAVEKYDGMSSISINIQNLRYIPSESLNNVQLLVLDELQNLYFQATFRQKVAGDCLVKQLKRFLDAGVKIMVVTGTPICRAKLAKELGLVSKEIIKRNTEEKDHYNFTFVEGLNYINATDFAQNLVKRGKVVVILSDLNRKYIRKVLIKNLADFTEIQTADKTITNSSTKYIVDNEKLPDNTDILLSTSVIAGGINLLETEDEKEIVYLTTVKDIGNPQNLIQLAGRSRNQKKVVYCGYDDEKDFDINFSHIVYDNSLNNIFKSDTVAEMEALLSGSFKNMKSWLGYIKRFCQKVEIYKEDFNLYIEEKEKLDEVNWSDFAKLIRAENIDKGKLYSEYFRVKSETTNNHFSIIDNPNNKGYNKWVFVNNVKKARNILRVMDLGFRVEDMSNEKITRLLQVVYVAKSFSYLTEAGYDGLRQDVLLNKLDLSSGAVQDLFCDLFKCSKVVNGKVEALTDWKKSSRVALPVYVFANYKSTVGALVRVFYTSTLLSNIFIENRNKFCGLYVEEFYKEDAVVEEAIEKKKEEALKAMSNGGKATKNNKKIKVISENNKRLKGLLNTEYASVNEASEKLGINRKTISRMLTKGLLEEV